MKCEHEVLCGIENCTKKDEECREMLIQKLIERKKEMEQQKEDFEQELAEAKKAASGPDIVFLCDKHACDKCSNSDCEHTKNIRHAKNFKMFGDMFVEKKKQLK